MSESVSGWQLHRLTSLTWEQLAGWIDPVIRGWMAYHGRFRRFELFPLLARINYHVQKWIRARDRRLRPSRQPSPASTGGSTAAGCQVTVQTLACPIGAAPAGAPAAGPGPPDPAVLAALARQTLGLPSPVICSSPAQDALQLTNLPTWLWINPAEWVPESKTAESVTATATPVSVTWHPGDGSTVTCQGAGHPAHERR